MNRNLIRRKALLLYVVLCLALAGCSDADKQLAIAAKTNLEVQKFVIEAEKSGQMSTAEAKVVIDATSRIATMGLSAVAVVERFKASDPASQTAALDALGAIVDELGKLQSTLGIKNPTTRHHVEGLLAAVATSLNASRVIIAATK